VLVELIKRYKRPLRDWSRLSQLD